MNKDVTLQQIISDYPIPETEYSDRLWQLALAARIKQQGLERDNLPEQAMAINNALYLILVKYIPKVEVTADKQAYLEGLFSAVKSAKYEFSQVCYASMEASDVIQTFYGYIMGEYYFGEQKQTQNQSFSSKARAGLLNLKRLFISMFNKR